MHKSKSPRILYAKTPARQVSVAKLSKYKLGDSKKEKDRVVRLGMQNLTAQSQQREQERKPVRKIVKVKHRGKGKHEVLICRTGRFDR